MRRVRLESDIELWGAYAGVSNATSEQWGGRLAGVNRLS